jgi:pSer/pThr/pTyr-binding forkhead associated (FHA) protein
MKDTQAKNDETQIRKPAEQTREQLKATVVILEGHGSGTEYEITKAHTVIGRDKTADLAVNDSLVSRQHAAIVYQEGSYILKDLESTNGTHMHGTPLKRSDLSHGDKFRIGDTTLQFVLEEISDGKVFEIE